MYVWTDLTATQDQREIGNCQQTNVKRRSLYYGHWQGEGVAVATVAREGQPSDVHVRRHIVAAEQQQFSARGMRQQRRTQNGQAGCIQTHDHR